MGKRFRGFGLIAVGVVALGAVAGGVAASIGPPRIAVTGYTLRAQLDPSQEVPAPAAAVPADTSGRFQALLANAPVYSRPPAGRSVKIVWKLAWRLTFSNLSRQVTKIQIDQGAKGQAGPMLISLCGPCGTPARGVVDVTAAKAKLLLSGGAYVNVSTAANAGGEVRGQIYKVRAAPLPTARP
jgi:CHRD domain